LEDDLYKENFDLHDYKVNLPCCEVVVPVLNLDFAGTAAFSKFVINIDDTVPVEKEIIEVVQSILGCKLEAIEAWIG
jgi:hypothetical protein